jgi:hypothetical protein
MIHRKKSKPRLDRFARQTGWRNHQLHKAYVKLYLIVVLLIILIQQLPTTFRILAAKQKPLISANPVFADHIAVRVLSAEYSRLTPPVASGDNLHQVQEEDQLIASSSASPSAIPSSTPTPIATPQPTPVPPTPKPVPTPTPEPINPDDTLQNRWGEIRRAVKKLAPRYGFPKNVALAQAALESGHGTSVYCVNRNNCFGLGAYDDNPNHAFAFTSIEAGVDYYMKLISSDPIYQKAWAHRSNSTRMIQEIKNAGYATDRSYVSKVTHQPEWSEK